MHTLWRNGTLLGQIEDQKHLISSGFVVQGILKPTPALAGTKPLMQTRNPYVAGAALMQRVVEPLVHGKLPPIEPIDLGEILSPDGRAKALARAASDSPVPETARLEIRSGDGTVMTTHHISLSRIIVPDHVDIAEVQREWGTTATRGRSGWSSRSSPNRFTLRTRRTRRNSLSPP